MLGNWLFLMMWFRFQVKLNRRVMYAMKKEPKERSDAEIEEIKVRQLHLTT